MKFYLFVIRNLSEYELVITEKPEEKGNDYLFRGKAYDYFIPKKAEEMIVVDTSYSCIFTTKENHLARIEMELFDHFTDKLEASIEQMKKELNGKNNRLAIIEELRRKVIQENLKNSIVSQPVFAFDHIISENIYFKSFDAWSGNYSTKAMASVKDLDGQVNYNDEIFVVRHTAAHGGSGGMDQGDPERVDIMRIKK